MGRSTHARRRERGQELVEFALILPLLLLLMVGIFEFGYVVFAYNTLSNAVREGARLGSVQPADVTGILERAQRLTIGLDDDALIFRVTWSVSGCELDPNDPEKCWTETYPGGPSNKPGRVRVQAEYEHALFTGFLWQAFGDDAVTLRAGSSMGVE